MEGEIGGNSHYLFKCSGLTKKQKNEPSLYIKLNTNLTQLGMKKNPNIVWFVNFEDGEILQRL